MLKKSRISNLDPENKQLEGVKAKYLDFLFNVILKGRFKLNGSCKDLSEQVTYRNYNKHSKLFFEILVSKHLQ
jgi:hypothetical protein